MEEDIKNALAKFHQYNEEARNHFRAHRLVPGETLQVHTEVDMMLYAKWRTKADLALNEYHTFVAELNPGKLPWSAEFLANEKNELQDKLDHAEQWLTQHSG